MRGAFQYLTWSRLCCSGNIDDSRSPQTEPSSPDAERRQRELDFQTILGPAGIDTLRYTSPDVEHTYGRALALCQQTEDRHQLFSVLMGQWMLYNTRAELQTAQDIGERLRNLAQQNDDPTLLIDACYAFGTTSHFLGELSAAQSYLEQGVSPLWPGFVCVTDQT